MFTLRAMARIVNIWKLGCISSVLNFSFKKDFILKSYQELHLSRHTQREDLFEKGWKEENKATQPCEMYGRGTNKHKPGTLVFWFIFNRGSNWGFPCCEGVGTELLESMAHLSPLTFLTHLNILVFPGESHAQQLSLTTVLWIASLPSVFNLKEPFTSLTSTLTPIQKSRGNVTSSVKPPLMHPVVCLFSMLLISLSHSFVQHWGEPQELWWLSTWVPIQLWH